jgi:hypothetical protein
MLRILLLLTILFICESVSAQRERFFLRNGDLMENIEGYAMPFASSLKGNVLGFTEGMYDGESTLFYWTSKNEAFICTLDPAGGSQTRRPFKCACQSADEEGINKMTLKNTNLLIVNCKSGNTYIITPEGEELYTR